LGDRALLPIAIQGASISEKILAPERRWSMERECDIVVRAFYEEYTRALSFLEEAGFVRSEIDEGLVQRIVYSKDDISVNISLDVRDIAIESYIRVCSRGLLGRGFLSDLLDASERADPEIQSLLTQERHYSAPKVYYKTVRERNEELVRPMIRASAMLDAAVLRKYGIVVLQRARQIAAEIYGDNCS
jgi:hypothetical protein